MGAFTLEGEGFSGANPWVYIQPDGNGGCSAVVATEGFDAWAYDVTVCGSEAVLEPVDTAAEGGGFGITTYSLTSWDKITLDLDGTGLAGTARADTIQSWGREDTFGQDPMTVDLVVEDAGAPVLSGSSSVVPWRTFLVRSSRPVPDLVAYLEEPGADWQGENHVVSGAEGLRSADWRFGGDWDDVRGQSFDFAVSSGLADLAGIGAATSNVAVDFLDIGPAIVEHAMSDLTTVASFGSVEPYTFGDCESLGCVSVFSDCNGFAGIVGQLDTTGRDRVVLSMRLDEGFIREPLIAYIEVVGHDGTPLALLSGGSWDVNVIEQTWVYDVAGNDTAGFAIEVSSYCHGWGGPVIVDSVRAE